MVSFQIEGQTLWTSWFIQNSYKYCSGQMLPEKHLLTFATHLNYFSLLKSKQDVSYPVTAPEIEKSFCFELVRHLVDKWSTETETKTSVSAVSRCSIYKNSLKRDLLIKPWVSNISLFQFTWWVASSKNVKICHFPILWKIKTLKRVKRNVSVYMCKYIRHI